MLNLSKSGGNTDQGSNCDERSERSDMHSPAHSVRDDSIERNSGRSAVDMAGGTDRNMDDEDIENMSDDNVSDVEERMVKDEEGTFYEQFYYLFKRVEKLILIFGKY